ncbi:tyrosine-protein kinase Dnt [Dendroctonus ponderosae]|uniref:receptor protein-tyrosine kinase n=1 Tax=Dendroctonus ponderosae TaxID=77166 RepID=A0AAR5PWH6_DENPD|nr:tyrosine-protein kinase Dnt [Dendroctonus ponderosae]
MKLANYLIINLYLILYVNTCSAYLNLYLSSQEVQRLLGLGIPAELYYIRDDLISQHALNFSLLIPPTVNDLYFTWQNIEGQQIAYSIKVKTSNTEAIPKTRLSIPSVGHVPSSSQTFAVNVPCSGAVEAEVHISIIVDIIFAKDKTDNLKILSKKPCLNANVDRSVTVNNLPQFANSSSIFYIAVCSAVLLICVLAILITLYYVKNKKIRTTESGGSAPTTTTTTFLAALPRNSVNASSYGSFRRMPSYSLLDDRSRDLQERITELTIQRCRVRQTSIVLEGTFGRVYQGSYTNEEGIEETVIIKTVAEHASQVQISLLLQEGMAMYSLNHKNILSILRVSIEDHTTPLLLYPYNDNTNLKIFLQKCKVSSEGVHHTLTTQEVVHMALQIIKAMQYLHKKHLLHKDLAARNCVVDDNLTVQIADNALSRDLFPSDYHCLGDNENRPVKWLALESLLHKTFTCASDVWSFGVLLWELTTLAQQPYIEIDPFEMGAYLKDGYRLAQPINCPDELFAVMAYCWAMSSEERPTFNQLHVCLEEFYTQLTKYV